MISMAKIGKNIITAKQNSEKLMTGKQKRVFACRNSLFVFHFFIIPSSFRAKLVSLQCKKM